MPKEPTPSRPPTRKRPTKRGTTGICKTDQWNLHYRESFKDGRTDGWDDAILAKSDAFTTFLGPYCGKYLDYVPMKIFKVPKNATDVHFRFWFYEIDRWTPTDKIHVYIDDCDVELDLGEFQHNQDEGSRSGSGPQEVTWTVNSLGPMEHLDYNPKYMDQRHSVKINVPRHFYKDKGDIDVRWSFDLASNDCNVVSAGIDRISIYVKGVCGDATMEELGYRRH